VKRKPVQTVTCKFTVMAGQVNVGFAAFDRAAGYCTTRRGLLALGLTVAVYNSLQS